MAIDYFGSFPCNVREAYSDSELLNLLKARSRANAALTRMRNDPSIDKAIPESNWKFRVIINTPSGREEGEVRIGDCLAATTPLEQLARHCVRCPANVRSADFGCGGTIPYPITEQAERWLISRLPSDLKTTRGEFLCRALEDFGYDGAHIDAARDRRDLYESAAPVERRWGGLLKKKRRVTSSQLLHMAFAVGTLNPDHAKVLAYFLGYLDDGFQVVDAPEALPALGDDLCTAELKQFFSILSLASAGMVSVFVDA